MALASDINVENNNPAVRASLERHASFEDSESFTVLAQRETEAALSRHLKQEEQLARNATRERLEASCVKYDEVDVKQEALSRRQVGHPCFFWRILQFTKGCCYLPLMSIAYALPPIFISA